MVFRVRDLAGLEAVARLPALEDAALDTAQAVLEQCAKFQQGGGREEVVDRQQTARLTPAQRTKTRAIDGAGTATPTLISAPAARFLRSLRTDCPTVGRFALCRSGPCPDERQHKQRLGCICNR